ncbi:DUF2971 domain-containing protein, partial [Methyloceanibacter sp.]|uniref:DUF2971 domain-containing protein n=1 Tax=Methyloceanibacter sp. TaxID=1965321 RepID=UPI003D6D6C6A
MNDPRPSSLFKYRSFSETSLEVLCQGEIYYADPSTFNDPLDCQPVVDADVSNEQLRQIFALLATRRIDKEIDLALRKLRLKGDGARARRRSITQTDVDELLGEIRYDATNPDIADQQLYIREALSRGIAQELRQSFGKGVFSLSERYDSPLMWSHYGNQHKGLCVEYDVSQVPQEELHRVRYGDSRRIAASRVLQWLETEDQASSEAVHRGCLLTKSLDWTYEYEWRMLGRIGSQASTAILKSITFGMRCSIGTQYATVAAVSRAFPGTTFWEIAAPEAHFELVRRELDADELMHSLPVASLL